MAHNVAIARYMRHMAGETIEEIASSDNVSVATVATSIAKGAEFESQRTAMKVMQLRDEGAMRNEEFRRQLRDEYFSKAKTAIDILLTGDNVVLDKNADGTINIRTYKDPKVLTEGLNQLRKFTSLEEKPQAATVINVQQNNQTNNISSEKYDFENTLAKIREQQKAANPDIVIDIGPDSVKQLPEHTDEEQSDWSSF